MTEKPFQNDMTLKSKKKKLLYGKMQTELREFIIQALKSLRYGPREQIIII